MSEADAGIQPDPAAGIEHPRMLSADGDQAVPVAESKDAAPDESFAAPAGELDETATGAPDWMAEAAPEGGEEAEGAAPADGLDEAATAEPDWTATEAPEGGERPEGTAPADGLDEAATGEPDWMATAGLDRAETAEAHWPGSTSAEPATMSQLIFVDVLIVLPSSNPVVVLQETESPYRELRIPIGGAEGIAIGYAARRIATPRPLTHELMSILLRDFDLTLEVVRITGSSGGSFTAEIVVSGPSGGRTIDCRPSDAIALALRQRLPVPIMASPEVLDEAGSGAAGSN